ncbi:MAG TPA: hypothetical protein VEA40_19545 [Ramlibacter sp.]|nr:hypothetical protein [Ramlibacter sp.]
MTASVIELPRNRSELPTSYGALHAAVRAGVGRAEAERARLVLGECAEPDPSARDGIRWHTATALLPPGVATPPGTLLDLVGLTSAAGHGDRHHGKFAAVAPPLAGADAIRAPFGDRLHTRCGGSGRSLRMQVRREVPGWEMDFAAAEARRHGSVTDQELATGRIVLLSCRLRMADGTDWHSPVWLARVPAGLQLRQGQVVRLQGGATEGSKDFQPLAQVLDLESTTAAGRSTSAVRCS